MAAKTRVIVGNSRPIQELRRIIDLAGDSRFPVLLLGETGTGKELVAQAIHSRRGCGAFVTIDCGSLVGPLVESELFGYIKGAFTGATMAKRGLIDIADNGTAFFDEIGDLPLGLQVKLLRVIQEREFRPVGGLTQKRVDFRIIAATNRDLCREVAVGNFRADLYYRLHVIKIRVPPLRERKEDIPELVDYFLRQVDSPVRMSNEAMANLFEYDWPGNVRELRNIVERIAAMSTTSVAGPADLPTVFRQARGGASGGLDAGVPSSAPKEPPLPSDSVRLDRVEKMTIIAGLRLAGGDRTKAAGILGIGRTTLYRKIKEYGIGAST